MHHHTVCNRATIGCVLVLTSVAGKGQAQNSEAVRPAPSGRVAVVRGYHGYNAPILLRALQPHGVGVDDVGGWLDVHRYRDYGLVIIDGWLERAHIEPFAFTPEDLPVVRQFLDDGGTLILMRHARRSLDTPGGRDFLQDVFGSAPVSERREPVVRFDHPWLGHLGGPAPPAWVRPGAGNALPASKGVGVIQVLPGSSILHHAAVGRGQLIYIGWDIFRFRPPGRSKVAPEQEQAFVEQVRILENIAASLYPSKVKELPRRIFFDDPYGLRADRVQDLPPGADAKAFASHPPPRPLPTVSDRPMGDGPARFVDGHRGDDAHDGTKESPWRTVQHAVDRLEPGQTLYLRGGTYYERVTLSRSGTPDEPITLRAYPNELAILDGGFREFSERPAQAWEPVPDGAPDEFRSVNQYPGLGSNAKATNLLGNFADSMVPLHGYRFLTDLRSDNPYWNISNKMQDQGAMYCGPGVWYDPVSQRIHVRLAHTRLAGLGEDNYRGETDPRKLRLVLAGRGSALTILGARHVRLLDLVLRGARGATLNLSAAGDIVLDGLAVYGGSTCVQAGYTHSLRAVHCAFRGIGAPWSFRSNLKYRAIEANVFAASGWHPAGNRDFELAYCEFTDCVDGIYLGNVSNVRFHHNLVDNFTDDGLFLTATATNSGEMPGGPILIYQNQVARCLSALAFGVGHGRQATTARGILTGAGLWVYRNVFDFRRPVYYFQPRGPDAPQELASFGRSQGDHGSPIWEPLFFYHNTIVSREPAFRSYYAHGWGGHMKGTVRAVVNNIVAQVQGPIGAAIDPNGRALLLDANLHWSLAEGGDLDAVQRSVRKLLGDRSLDVAAFPRTLRYPHDSKGEGPHPLQDVIDLASDGEPIPFRAQHDQGARPRFVRFEGDWRRANDYRLTEDSPAVNGGIRLPEAWPDPLRPEDPDGADLGAIPLGHDGWRIGIGGRFHVAVHPN